MKTQEAIYYYGLNPQIATRVIKKMGFSEELNEREERIFVNMTLTKMQEKIARKMSKQSGIKYSKAIKAIQAMCIFEEERMDIEEFFERCQ